MSSSFFGLTIAGSALNAYQAATNATANNIANVQTAGYSKQVANIQSGDALRVSNKYGTMGTGVTTASVTQIRDSYYDTKYWRNQSSIGLYDRRLYYMEQIESIYQDDDTKTGFATILSKMFNSLDTLKNNAGDTSVRNQFISDAQNLTTYFNSTATQLTNMQTDINNEVKSTVDTINSIAQKVALLTKQINAVEIQGGHANELRDERALLLDDLSEIVPIEVTEYEVSNSNFPDMYTGATNFYVKLNGQNLVDTYEYHELAYSARENKINQTDVDGLYDITWKDTGVSFNPTSSAMSGSLKALFELRDGNCKANFTGTVGAGSGGEIFGTAEVDGKTVSTITIVSPSVTDVKKLNIAQEGILTINNNKYNYSDFVMNRTAVPDANGNTPDSEGWEETYETTYTFTLEQELSYIEKGKMSGKPMNIGASIDYMGIPYYMSQMSEFIRVFASSFNDLQQGTADDPGVDLNGNEMGAFFTAYNIVDGSEYDFDQDIVSSYSNSYYQLTAATFQVAEASVKDPTRIATKTKKNYTDGVDQYNVADAILKLQSDTTMYRGCAADDFLRLLLSDVTVDTNEATIFTSNYKNIGDIIDNQRQSISGVDEDEEAMDLVKFQNAYNLASKMISVLAEMYDQLILNTGL